MSWVRLDDQMPNHPKILGMGQYAPLALTLQVRALCWSSHYLTDGFVPVGAMPALTAGFEVWVVTTSNEPAARNENASAIDWLKLMFAAGVWHKTKGGFRIHDYHEYNPTKETVLKERAENRARQGRFRGRNATRNGVTNGELTGLSQVPPAPAPAPADTTDTSAKHSSSHGADRPAREGAPAAPEEKARGKPAKPERLAPNDFKIPAQAPR